MSKAHLPYGAFFPNVSNHRTSFQGGLFPHLIVFNESSLTVLAQRPYILLIPNNSASFESRTPKGLRRKKQSHPSHYVLFPLCQLDLIYAFSPRHINLTWSLSGGTHFTFSLFLILPLDKLPSQDIKLDSD